MSRLFHRDSLLQFFEPVEGDVNLRGRGFVGIGLGFAPHHDEVLAIGSDVVGGRGPGLTMIASAMIGKGVVFPNTKFGCV